MLKLTMIWCDHSNETSKVVLSQGTICILAFYEMNYELFVLTFAGAPSLIISQSAITDIQTRGGGVLPYMGDIGTCCGIGYGF